MSLLQRFLVLLAGLATGAALAAPADDFAAGSAAYRQGDVRGAIASLRKAADAGHAKAQVLLGTILDAAEDDAEAARYLALAAKQDDPEGMYLLAGHYSAGEGVPRDLAQARSLYERAAALGHRESTFALATVVLGGGLGYTDAERASPEAVAWLRKAADLGHLPSLDRLAVAYRNGELGLPRDAKLAGEAEAKAQSIRGVVKRTPARRGSVPRAPAGG